MLTLNLYHKRNTAPEVGASDPIDACCVPARGLNERN